MVLTPNSAPRVVRSPCALNSSHISCMALPAAYSANIRCTNGAVSSSTTYFLVSLSTPYPHTLCPLNRACWAL